MTLFPNKVTFWCSRCQDFNLWISGEHSPAFNSTWRMRTPLYNNVELSMPGRGQSRSRNKFDVQKSDQQSMLEHREEGGLASLSHGLTCTVNIPLNIASWVLSPKVWAAQWSYAIVRGPISSTLDTWLRTRPSSASPPAGFGEAFISLFYYFSCWFIDLPAFRFSTLPSILWNTNRIIF